MVQRVVAVVAVLATWLAAAPAGAVSSLPAYAGDFPDPFVLTVDGTYWAYSTGSAGRNLQVTRSSDLSTWTPPRDPLPVLPAWASVGLTWAPSVVASGGRYLMYYTVHETASGRQCVSVAEAAAPEGPFTDLSAGPLVCQLDHGGSIDPATITVDGVSYLLWKSDDNALGATTHLWGQRLSVDGRSLAGERVRLLDQTARWQDGVVEGPSMLAVGDAFVLFYGAGRWDSSGAGIGYATCAGPLGPCRDRSRAAPWLASRPGALGPSGPTTFTDTAGMTRMAYHAWTGAVGYENGGQRALFVDALRFTRDGRPILA